MMSTPNFPASEPKYYDPGEVEAYISDATDTINALQARLTEAIQRADEAERALGDGQPETASLGRALLLASEVADKTLADADAKAADIIQVAEERARSITAAAESEGRRIVEAAERAAADVFIEGESRLLAAVNAFVEGSNILRDELAKVEKDATSWRVEPRPSATTGFAPGWHAQSRSSVGARPVGSEAGAIGGSPSHIAPSPRYPTEEAQDRSAGNGIRPWSSDRESPVAPSPYGAQPSPFSAPDDQRHDV